MGLCEISFKTIYSDLYQLITHGSQWNYTVHEKQLIIKRNFATIVISLGSVLPNCTSKSLRSYSKIC